MNAKKQAGNAPNAQNKSTGDYGSEGLGFESLRARKTLVFDLILNFIELVTRCVLISIYRLTERSTEADEAERRLSTLTEVAG